jgi:hypothetical protein
MNRLDLGLEPDDKEFHAMLEALVTAHGVTKAAEFMGVPDRTLRHWRLKGDGAAPAHRRLVWLTYQLLVHSGAILTSSDLLIWCRNKLAGWPTLPPQELGSANLLAPSEPPSAPDGVCRPTGTLKKLVIESMETIALIQKAMETANTFMATAKDKEEKVKTLGMIANLAKSQSDLSNTVNDILKVKPPKDPEPDSGPPELPRFYRMLNEQPVERVKSAKNDNK